MPLTHLTPPKAVRAIHEQECKDAAAKLSAAILAYLRKLLWTLEYPRAEWLKGTGQDSTPGLVTAAPEGAITSGGTTSGGPWVTGSDTPSGAAIRGKPVLLVAVSDATRPTPAVRRYFDGKLEGITADPGSPLTPRPTPAEPGAFDMTTLDEDTYEQYTTQWGRYLADTIAWIVDQEYLQHFAKVTRFPTAIIESVDTRAKTARVRALTAAVAGEQPPAVIAGFGPRLWTTADVGKQVRLGFTRGVGYWLDDRG